MISSYKKPKVVNNQKRNDKISFLEVLAILLIIVIAIILLTPTAERLRDEINKRQYITNVNRYVDKAIDMYGNDNYKDKFVKDGKNYIITFSNIEDINITKDPYGFNYKLEDSYVEFNSKTKDIVVNVKSCVVSEGNEYCYEIADVNTKDLTPNSIKASVN